MILSVPQKWYALHNKILQEDLRQGFTTRTYDKGLREDKLLDNLGDTASVIVKRGDVVCLAFKLFGRICHKYAKAGRFNHG